MTSLSETTQTASSKGPSIAYTEAGTGGGLPILCLTGWCSTRHRYEKFARLAARTRRVVALDWRGHGDSQTAKDDFGTGELTDDAIAVIDAAGLDEFAVVSASHSGWVALELVRRLGDRIPKVVHFDWLVVEPSEPYLEVIRMLQDEAEWPTARDTLYRIWRGGSDDADVERALEAMSRQGADMWMRSGREIEGAFAANTSPLAAWSAEDSQPQILHVYGQPRDPEYLARQRAFAAEHGWFDVEQLDVRSHFTMIEAPTESARIVDAFLAR